MKTSASGRNKSDEVARCYSNEEIYFMMVPVIKGSVQTMIKRTMENLQEFLLYRRNLETTVLLRQHLKRMMKEGQLLLRYQFIRIF